MPITEAEAARLAALLAPEGGCDAALPLVTDRMVLRPLGPEDAPAIAALADAWSVARFTGRVPHPYRLTDARRWVQLETGLRAEGGGLALLMTDRIDGTVMGAISLVWQEAWPSAELGYWVGEPFRGRGLTEEAGRAMLQLAFEGLNLTEVFATARADNTASLRVLDKLGLRPDGRRMRVNAVALGEVWELERQSLDRTTWEADRAARSRILLVVAAALVDMDGRVLLTQRPEGKPMAGLWEFPGGKVHDGETPERALIRELHEELGIDARGSCLAPLAFASHAYADFHLLMPLYVLRSWRGEVTPKEGQDLAWVRAARLRDYPMPPADPPLIPALQDLLAFE